MPSILQYHEQQSVSGAAGSVPRSSAAAAGSGYAALAQVAERLGQLKEQDAAADAALTLSKTASHWQQQLLERQEQADPGAPDFTKNLEKDFDDYRAKALETATTRSSKLYLQQGLAQYRSELLDKGLLFESAARVTHRKAQFGDSIDLTATQAELDPEHYEARLQEQLAALEVLDVPPAEKEALRTSATDMIQSRAAIGYARRDPDGTMKRVVEPAADDKLFRTLSPRARDQVLQEVENSQRLRINADNRAYMLAERAEQEAADGKQREGDLLYAKGALSMQWVVQNQKILAPDDVRYFSRLASGRGGSDGDVNTTVYADLRDRASRGEDVRGDARKALHDGQIDIPAYDRLFGEVEAERPGWYKRGSAYISTAAGVSDLNPDPDAARRKANMLDDWQRWASENPKASDSEAKEAYTRITDEYSIIDRQKMTITLRAPSYLVGDRMAPDLEATEAATVKAYESGELGPAEFQRQAELLAQWRAAIGNTSSSSKAK